MVVYLYQDPFFSYGFTKLREEKGIRHVPDDVFINNFFGSIENYFYALDDLREYNLFASVVVVKDAISGEFEIQENILTKKKFDRMLLSKYNFTKGKERESLKKMLENGNDNVVWVCRYLKFKDKFK